MYVGEEGNILKIGSDVSIMIESTYLIRLYKGMRGRRRKKWNEYEISGKGKKKAIENNERTRHWKQMEVGWVWISGA